MNKIEKVSVRMNGCEVGTLALTQQGLCVFQYSRSWLVDGFSISPFELPLKEEITIAKPSPFSGNFGVFDDALPDGWGLLILDRYLRSQNIDPNRLSLLEQLAYVGSAGRGALEFLPDKSGMDTSAIKSLQSIEKEIAFLLDSEDYTVGNAEELWRRGGSPGGARPKIFLNADGRQWLVKFPARQDPPSIGLEEYKYSQIAKECGIDMPETKLFDGRYFGVERFDRRNDGEKIHTVTAAGLLGADYRIPSIDYTHLMKLTRILTQSESEVWRMFRLMVFNYLINNKDDHAKNFSFVYRSGQWRLSPAYDLLPSEGINGFHTTSFNNSIEPTDNDILTIALENGLNENKAQRILNDIREIVQERTTTL